MQEKGIPIVILLGGGNRVSISLKPFLLVVFMHAIYYSA